MKTQRKPKTVSVEVRSIPTMTNFLMLIYPDGSFRLVSVKKFVSMVMEGV